MLVRKEAVRTQSVPGNYPGGEHHPEGHRCPVPQQAHGVFGGQELHPEVFVLPQGRKDGRDHDVHGGLPFSPSIQGCHQEGAATATSASVSAVAAPASRGSFFLSANLPPGDQRQLESDELYRRKSCFCYYGGTTGVVLAQLNIWPVILLQCTLDNVRK